MITEVLGRYSREQGAGWNEKNKIFWDVMWEFLIIDPEKGIKMEEWK